MTAKLIPSVVLLVVDVLVDVVVVVVLVVDVLVDVVVVEVLVVDVALVVDVLPSVPAPVIATPLCSVPTVPDSPSSAT